MPVTIVCPGCDQAFSRKPSQAKRETFCSLECRKSFTASQRITKTCAQCGEVYTRPNWKVWRETIYCSLACRDTAIRSLSTDEREALMTGCREATRKMVQTDEHRHKIARTKQERAVLSGDEAAIMAGFNAAGLFPVPLFAIHRYNIDFAFPDARLAIEYNGGNWHNTPKKRREDAIKQAWLEANGWTVVFFPRIDKPQENNAGNERITVDDLVDEVSRLLHR